MNFFGETVYYLFYFVMLLLFIGIGLAIICALFWLWEHKQELLHRALRWVHRAGGIWWRVLHWHRRRKRLRERARQYMAGVKR